MVSESTELKIDVEQGSSWSRKLSITVPAGRVQRTRGRIAEQVARGARLPGFRKGKLPLRVIEQRFGASIDQETIDRLVQEAYREALEAQGIVPISRGRVDDVRYDPGAELSFDVEVEVKPELKLERLGGFSATRPSAAVTDEEVDAVLERLRDERGEWQDIDAGSRPEYGDQVLVEIIARAEDGSDEEPRSYRLVLGEGQAIPDVENAILTLTAGETGEFTIKFPEDFPDESRRGQEQHLRIEVKEAQRKVLPEIDDAFAAAVGEFENVAALRERIHADLTADAEQRADSEVRNQLIDQILEANPFEAPNSMLERYIGHMIGEPVEDDDDGHHHHHDHQHHHRRERSPEEEEQLAKFRESIRPTAEWGLKRMLVIEAIGAQEGLRATQDEIDARVEEIAEKHGRSPSEVWIQLEKSGQLEALEREITENKIFDFLKSQNTVA